MHTEQHPCKSMQATKARRKNARSIAAAKQKHFLANFSNRKTEVDKSTNQAVPQDVKSFLCQQLRGAVLCCIGQCCALPLRAAPNKESCAESAQAVQTQCQP